MALPARPPSQAAIQLPQDDPASWPDTNSYTEPAPIEPAFDPASPSWSDADQHAIESKEIPARCGDSSWPSEPEDFAATDSRGPTRSWTPSRPRRSSRANPTTGGWTPRRRRSRRPCRARRRPRDRAPAVSRQRVHRGRDLAVRADRAAADLLASADAVRPAAVEGQARSAGVADGARVVGRQVGARAADPDPARRRRGAVRYRRQRLIVRSITIAIRN